MKIKCSRCKQEKPDHEFLPSQTKARGAKYCEDCRSEKGRDYRAKMAKKEKKERIFSDDYLFM